MGQASDAYIDYLHTQCVFTADDNGEDNNDHKYQRRLGVVLFVVQLSTDLKILAQISIALLNQVLIQYLPVIATGWFGTEKPQIQNQEFQEGHEHALTICIKCVS